MSYDIRDTVVIQHACAETQPMLALTLPLHTRYCLSFGMDYWPVFGSVMPKREAERKGRHYEKLFLMKQAFEAGYGGVIVLDMDTLIVTEEDLRLGIPQNCIGMSWHSQDWTKIDPSGEAKLFDHYNMGVILAHNTPETKAFLWEWYRQHDFNHCWQAQNSLRLTAESWKKTQRASPLVTIDHRYNATYPNYMTENPAILAWHGYGNLQQRMDAMIEAVRNHSPQYRDNAQAVGSSLPVDLSAKNKEECILKARYYASIGNHEAAIVLFRSILTDETQDALLWKELANSYNHLGQWRESVAVLQTCLRIEPEMGEVWRMLAGCYIYLGEHQEACIAAEESIRYSYNAPGAHVNHALCLLKEGNWQAGFQELQFDFVNGNRKLRTVAPAWDGKQVDTLFVWAEQGLGDTIQLFRYLQLIVGKKAQKVVFEAQSPLVKLLTGQMENVDVVPQRQDYAIPFSFDEQIGVFSLPLVFPQVTPQTCEEIFCVPYLKAPQEAVEKWRERIIGDFRVGFVWGGNPGNANDANRSMLPAAFNGLILTEGVSFYCLQRDVHVPDTVKENTPTVTFLGEEIEDMTDSAGILANLDLLISVDTAILHLAGAMGVKTWGLISKSSDWRWGTEEKTDSVLYPSVTLYRQKTLGDWQEVMSRVESDLKGLPL